MIVEPQPRESLVAGHPQPAGGIEGEAVDRTEGQAVVESIGGAAIARDVHQAIAATGEP